MRSLVLLLVTLTASIGEAQSALTPVVMVGSSSACGPLGQRFASEIREITSTRRRSICHSATGLARPDAFDWQAEAETLSFDGDNVMLFLGGNDAQGLRFMHRREWRWIRWGQEAEWRALYTERTTQVVNTMCDRGATTVVVVLPPPVLQERLEGRLARVRESLAAGTALSRCGVVLETSVIPLPDEDSYLSDEVHLSRLGSRRAWETVGPTLLGMLGLSLPEPEVIPSEE